MRTIASSRLLLLIAVGVVLTLARSGRVRWAFGVVRYRPNGRLDRTFSGDGRATAFEAGGFARGLVAQASGKIVIAGRTCSRRACTFAVARFTRGGRLDNRFGGDGKVVTNIARGSDAAHDVAIQQNGRIVAAGETGGRGGRFALARYRGG